MRSMILDYNKKENECLIFKKKCFMKTLKTYWKIFNNYRIVGKEFWWYLLLGVAAQACIVLMPKLVELIVHTIDETKNVSDLHRYLIIFGTIVVFFTLLNRLYHVKGDKLLHDIYVDRQIHYRAEFLRMDYKHVQKVGTGKGISKITQGIGAESEIYYSLVQILLQAVIKGSVLLIIISVLEPIVLLLIASAIGLITLLNTIFYKKLKPITKRIHATYEQNSRDVVRTIAEHLLIKVANKKHFELKRGRENIKNLPKDEARASLYQYSFFDVLFMLIRFCEIVIYAYVGMMVLQGDVPISYMIMITSYLFAFWWPIEESVLHLSQINRQMVKYEKLQEFINQENDVQDGQEDYQYIHGEILFNSVSFGYNGDDQKNVKNCNLRIQPKKTTALVGHSGSGKSTLIKLILRLYDVRKGSISIDGQNIKDLKIESLYQHIAYISQEPSIFDGTVRDNLMYAVNTEKMSDKKLWKALRAAQAEEFVKNMEFGLDTEIGERGVFLSGGEKQRLAIARIFLKNPEILILDEPTSALDSQSEAKITEILHQVMKGRTVIVIAHRLQTVRDADHIAVMDNGSVIEEGSHQELIELDGQYAKLVKLQNGL